MLTEAQFITEFNLLRKQNFWNSFDNNQLKIILGTMIAAGLTGSGSGATSSADIAAGINSAVDIDTLLLRLASIDTKIPNGGFATTATIQRAANTTAYSVNDAYGAAFELTNFGSAGGHVILSGIRAIFNITTLPVSMSGFTLFLYSLTPPSAVSDNGAFSIPAGDRLALLTPGGIDLGSAVAGIGGGSVVIQADNLNIQLKLSAASTSVWGYLVTRSAFTPAAASETATITALTLGV